MMIEWANTPQPVIGIVSDPWREAKAEQLEESEHQVGVAGGIGRVFFDPQVVVIVQDPIEHIGRLACGGGDQLGSVLDVLLRRPAVDRRAFIDEVLALISGDMGLHTNSEPLPV